MQSAVLSWEFLSFWQSSSGKGEHMRLDALTARDSQGLPVLPGRTIKGLFRDAAQQLALWGQFDQDAIVSLFGKADDTESSTGTGNGLLVFDSAYVSRELEAAYDKQELTDPMLYRDLAQTGLTP